MPKQHEQRRATYYTYEFVSLVSEVLPIGLLLMAMIFLRPVLAQMKRKGLIVALTLVLAPLAHSDDGPTENPVSEQFRKHLENADQNKDGYVTREELAVEIGKEPGRNPKSIGQIVGAMMIDLDTDHDGKLSAAEIAKGARMAGENATAKQNVTRAQLVMDALSEYKKSHYGSLPISLEELSRDHLVPEAALRCILSDGQEKSWGYDGNDQQANDRNAVILFSPGRVDSNGKYIVGLGDGRVLGLDATNLDLEKVPKLKMHVYPGK